MEKRTTKEINYFEQIFAERLNVSHFFFFVDNCYFCMNANERAYKMIFRSDTLAVVVVVVVVLWRLMKYILNEFCENVNFGPKVRNRK